MIVFSSNMQKFFYQLPQDEKRTKFFLWFQKKEAVKEINILFKYLIKVQAFNDIKFSKAIGKFKIVFQQF